MGEQAETWLSQHKSIKDQSVYHPRSLLYPPVRGLHLLCPQLTPFCCFPACDCLPDSHNQGALPSLSNCVFLLGIISFKRGSGRGEKRRDDYEGAHSRVQRVERPSPSVTLLCGKINMAQLMSYLQYFFDLCFSPAVPIRRSLIAK